MIPQVKHLSYNKNCNVIKRITDPLEQKYFFEYDVAMILLSEPFDLSKSDPKIMSVCLPNKKYPGTVNIESIGKNQDIIIMGTGEIDHSVFAFCKNGSKTGY